MASADFPPNGGTSPEPVPHWRDKSILLPPIPAESIPIIVFVDFVSQNLTKLKSGPHIQFLFPVSRYTGQAVSTGVCRLAFPVTPGQALHCIPHGKPACDLLMLQSGSCRTAHKGLTPSGNISCSTLLFISKNLYFQHFFRAFSKVCTCSCCAHTFCKLHCGVRAVRCLCSFLDRHSDSRN
jgi:hypothetical protein